MTTSRPFTQTLQDVTVAIPVAPGTGAKILDVEIKPRRLAVRNKATGDMILEGDLFAPIDAEESTWCVDGAELVLTLEKKNQHEWWPHVLTKDPKIDVTKIRPENSRLSDLDPQTRATVEKMMFDNQQKQRGLPTADEIQKQKIMDNFKKMHPELDFSKLDEYQK